MANGSRPSRPGCASSSSADYVTLRRNDRPSPPVADRIKLDLSLAELPALPSAEPQLSSQSHKIVSAARHKQPLPDIDSGPGPLARPGLPTGS